MAGIADMRCDCGCAEVMAVAPGDADDRPGDLFLVSRGDRMQCWCEPCWLASLGVVEQVEVME